VEPVSFRQLLRDARVSKFEEHTFLTGCLLLVAGSVLAGVNGTAAGPAWLLGWLGLGSFGLCAGSRAARLYRASGAASLPRSVGRTGIRIRPRRTPTATMILFALVIPFGSVVALAALVEWGWLALGGGLLLGCFGLYLKAMDSRRGEPRYPQPPDDVAAALERLCMRADVPVPELIVEQGLEANAWTTGGRIHITTPLLLLLDRSEVEAVLAHELAHLAHRDAAVMDVCSAPSRVLLGYAWFLTSGVRLWVRNIFDFPLPGVALWVAILAAVSVPPTWALGWVSRVSVLHMSRAREFAADAAASALTGRPSALASALLKLDGDAGRLPDADLRQAEARAVLCILGSDRSRLGPLFCTHPRTAERVNRLQAIERRVQASGRAVSLGD
jgi:heat shock protein HtpX